nr:putative lrr receptor-like serine/threonine-protein kinase [Quercus suber]
MYTNLFRISKEQDSNCLHVKSGGKKATIKENKKNVVCIKGDGEIEGGAAKYFINSGFSSIGDFMDDYNYQNTQIQFTNEKTYNSLRKRIFDIYVQEKLVWKDFSIEDNAGIALKPIIKCASNISVTNNVLEIRFYWAGKGTMRIPDRGAYGPLISAVSVVSGSLIANALPVIAVKQLSPKSKQGNREFLNEIGMVSRLQHPNLVKLYGCCIEGEQLLLVYEYMDNNNLAYALFVKQLSPKSKQGNREFLNEIGMVSRLQHPNLVKLYGCCIEGEQLLLVYEYMDNNNLAYALFGRMTVPDMIPERSTYNDDLSMAAANAGQIDHAQPGPIDESVLTLQANYRSEAIWNRQDPGSLTCRSCSEKFSNREPMVDD